MLWVAVAWIYVVLMMAVAEAMHADGTVLGAFFTFLLYGVLPLSIVLYLMGTPGRWRARKAVERAELAAATSAAAAAAAPAAVGSASAEQPDGSGHASGGPGAAVAAKREEA